MGKKIMMLCSDCFSSRALYHYISPDHPISRIVVEVPLRGSALVKKRLKKHGWWKVTGQVLFALGVMKPLQFTSNKRVQQIKAAHNMDDRPLPGDKIRNVVSVNTDECIALIRTEDPDIILVNGTRIISKKVLESTKAIFINMHTGITPQYRGVHGGYWSLANNDEENFGVTIHLVDKGIDTGGVLYQGRVKPSQEDNFITYPYLQFAAGLPLVKKAIEDIENNRLTVQQKEKKENSRLWYHPTIWSYLYNRVRHNKK